MNEAAQRRSVSRVLDALTGPEAVTVPDLAERAAQLLDGAGASVAVGGDLRCGGTLVALSTTGLGAAAEEVQRTLGEGPTYTAHGTGHPVSVPHLEDDTTWVMFGQQAAHRGIGAVFAFPLRSARATLGALTLYRRQPDALTAAQRDDATTFATFVSGFLRQEHGEQGDGALLAGEPEASVINQATGMVGAQLGLDVLAAMALLRARAIASDRTLHGVAGDIVDRRLRLEDLWG